MLNLSRCSSPLLEHGGLEKHALLEELFPYTCSIVRRFRECLGSDGIRFEVLHRMTRDARTDKPQIDPIYGFEIVEEMPGNLRGRCLYSIRIRSPSPRRKFVGLKAYVQGRLDVFSIEDNTVLQFHQAHVLMRCA